MFTYRKTTKAEEEKWNNKCALNLPNFMRCPRRITRVVNNFLLCEGHYQIQLAAAKASKQEIVDLDEGTELLTGKSEPTEK